MPSPRPHRRDLLRRSLGRSLAVLAAAAVLLGSGVQPATAAMPTAVDGTDPAVAAAALEATTATVALSANPVLVGAPLTATATLTSATGVPTGTVTFSVNGTDYGTVGLVDGVASVALDGLVPGSYWVRAQYAGDATHAATVKLAPFLRVGVTDLPLVTEVTPAVVGEEGGARVALLGAYLTAVTGVTFGGVPGTLVDRDDSRLLVEVPPHAPGTVQAVVTTVAGTSSPLPVEYVGSSAGMVSRVPVRIEDESHTGPQPHCLQVTGTKGVPAGASGVMLNVTVVAPYQVGYLTVYPDVPGPRQPTSTVNFEVGREVANAAFVALPPNGRLCYARVGGIARVILDVTGFTMPGSGTELQDPVRLVDTRPTPYRVGEVNGPVGPGVVHTVQVGGRAGVPADATAVIVNATVTNVTGPGNLRVFPAGAPVPNASVLNYAPGKDKANAAIVALSSSGQLSFYSDTDGSTVDVVLDVTGYVTAGGVYAGVTPARALDTRPGAGHVGDLVGPLEARTPYTFALPAAKVPAGATSVVLNVTAIDPSGYGNLRVYPSGLGDVPFASTLNYVPGRDIPNLVVVDLPDDGSATVTLFSDMVAGGTVHVAADVAGYVVP